MILVILKPIKLTFYHNGFYLCQLTDYRQLFMIGDKIFADAQLYLQCMIDFPFCGYF